MKFMSFGAALSLDIGALVSKMLPLCEMQLVQCDLVHSACNGELFAFAEENVTCTEASHCYTA